MKKVPAEGRGNEIAAELSDSPAERPVLCVGFRRFRSLSSDPEDQFFCEGLTTEVVASMQSRWAGLRIVEILVAEQERMISAAETESYAPKMVLVGKLRKSGGRFRISVQLMNIVDGSVIWSEVYEGHFDNAVAIQQIAPAIVQTIPVPGAPCRSASA